MSSELEQVVQALHILHGQHTPAEDRKKADLWLIQLRQSPEAWKISVDAIQAPHASEEVTVFAAQSLLRKVQKQFKTLPAEDRPALLGSLQACLQRVSQQCTQAISPLAVALAALVVQWPAWDGSLQQIGVALTQASDRGNAPHTTALRLACSNLPAMPMLHFIAALPAEAQSVGSLQSAATDAQSASDKVLSWGADVMRWLYSTAQRCPDQQTLVVEAFAAWVRLGLLYEQELPHTEVHGLLSLTFQALLHSSDGNLGAASSAAIDIAEQTPEQMQPLLLPAVMPLPGLAQQAATDGNCDRAGRLCTSFAAYCSSAMGLWTSNSSQGEALRSGLHACAMLQAEDLPVTGEPVAAAALAAWTYLADYAHSLEASRDDSHPGSGVLGSAQLKQCFMGLLTSVLPLLGLPSYNGVEDEKQTVAASPIAYAAKDCLQAVCNLLGPSAYLGTAAQLFLSSSATDKEAVHLAEGILFAIHAAEDMISDFLGAEEDDADGGQGGQRAAVGQLLQILHRSASLHTEAPREAAVPLGAAILEPLCQLITSMLGLLQSQPADAQGLLLASLNLAARCSQEPKLARLAASCIEHACEGAVAASVDIPQKVILGLVQAVQAQSSDAEVQQALVLALAHCLSISSNADLQQQVIDEVLRDLVPACQHLHSLFHSPGSEGAALQRAREDASRAAESAFTRQRAFLHQAGTYHGQGGALGGHMAPLGEPAEGALAQKVVGSFAAAWPSMQAVLVLPCPGVAELREVAARCCTLAMRADRKRCIPMVISSAALQASLLTVPGGTYFSSPLGVALSSYTEEPQCRGALISALSDLASSPDVRQLAQPGAPDQQPEAALAVLAVTTAAARAMSERDQAECRLVTQSLPMAAACLTANHKELPATALSCLDALLEAAHVQGPVREVLLSALVTSAAALVAAVLRSLISPFGIGRVHRAASALCHLHALAAQQQQSAQQASTWLLRLLEGALGSLQQEGHAAPDVAQTLCTELQQALQSLEEVTSTAEAERGILASAGGRHLKRALRAFAEDCQGAS